MADDNGKPSPAMTAVLPEITGASLNGCIPADGSAAAAGATGTAPAAATPADAPAPIILAPPAGMSASRGHSLRALLAVLATGLVLGGLAGSLIGSVTAGGATASALVELAALPDPWLAAAEPTPQSLDTLTTFVAGEFAQLSGDGFRSAVADKVGSTQAPPIEVSRIGTSSVVSFSATGATEEAGLQVVKAAVEVYTQRRTDDFRRHIQDSIASVDQTLKDVDVPPANRTEPPASRQARIDRLLTLRADLLLLSHRTRAPVQILQPPAVPQSSRTSPLLLSTVLGAVIGGLLAVGARALRRSRTTTILTAADAETVTDRVLYPEVRLSRDWATTSLRVLRPCDRYASRLLVAQIAGPRPLSGRVVSVVGASSASASRTVAAMIAVGAAAQTPTLLVEFGDTLGGHPLVSMNPADLNATPASGCLVVTTVQDLKIMRLPGARCGTHLDRALLDRGRTRLLETMADGHCIVVDAGTSPEVLKLLPVPVEAVMVLGLGVDSKPHSAALAAAIPATTVRPLGIVTRLPWHEQLREWGRARRHA